MKKLILAIFALALASCAKEQFSESRVVLPGQELTITATSGDPETRTERASDGSVLWSPGDQISLFYGSGTDGGSCFTAQNTETAKVANFTGTIGVITGGNDVSVEDTYFWATYPYNATASCDGASVTTVLPSEQVATPDTFSDDLFPSIGRSQGLNMAFYNICGGLKFTVSEEGIKSVTLKGNNGEQIAGRITVGFGEDERPAVTGVADGSETITVSAPAGETFEVGRAYYIVLVPTTFESGFTLTFSKGYAEATYERAKKTTIKRSSFGTLTTPDAGLEWTMLYVQIPDENFRAYMVQRFDTNGNGVLDFDEAEAVQSISVNTDNITSLEGVEYCKNLQSLCCSGTGWSSSEGKYIYGGLTSLDVTQNTALQSLSCDNNQLTSLDVSHNTALQTLSCEFNQLTSLDVGQNTSLTGLYCYNNQLTSLDVTQNTALQTLRCHYNQLTSLDVSHNTALTDLECGSNQLTNLDFAQNTALKILYCDANQLTSLDVSQNTALRELCCHYNQLTSLDVSKNISLIYLSCYNNRLTSLDVSKNISLIYLSCSNNQLTSLDVTHNTALQTLRCHYNQLTSLDVAQNTALQALWCSYNQLMSLDVSQNTALTDLRCNNNQLTSLDVTHNTALQTLRCHYNQLTSLDVSKNTALSYLYCSPMNDNQGNNLLDFLYIYQGQTIPNVTENRSSNYIPAGTIIMVAPETGGNEGTGEEDLD